MNAPASRVLTLRKPQPAASSPAPVVVRAPKKPIVLTPLSATGRGGAWGKPDSGTAAVAISNMAATTPGTVVPWTTREKKLRSVLRTYHFATE